MENGSDIVVSKVVDQTTPAEGDTILYTIMVGNNGPAQATNVSVDDVLPVGVTATGTNTPSQGSYNGTTWTIGTIDTGNSATLTIEATVDGGTGGLVITNTVTNVTADQVDSDLTTYHENLHAIPLTERFVHQLRGVFPGCSWAIIPKPA